MITQFAKVSWAQRGIYAATAAALSTGACVFAVLAVLGSSMTATTQGDPGTLVVIGVIAAACTVVVLDAITRHGISERWHTLRRLRVIGLGAWSLRGYLAAETVLLALAASLVGYAAALVIAPALVPYLSEVGVLPAGLRPRPTLATLALVTGVTALVALFAGAGAARRAARREPVSVGLIAEQTPIARGLGIAFTAALAALTALSVWQAMTAVSTQDGFLWGMLATAFMLGLLGRIWRYLADGFARLMISARPGMSAPALISTRWTTSAGRATTPAAVMLAVGLCVFFLGYPSITEQAAKDRLSQMLAGTTILTHSAAEANTAAVDPDGTGIVLREAEVAVQPGFGEPAQFLTGADAEALLGPYLVDDVALDRPGVVITAAHTVDTGMQVDQDVTLHTGPGEAVTLPVIAVAAVPGTFADIYLINGAIPDGTATGPTTLITSSPADTTSPGWHSQSAEQWVADLPPGAAVSATGGQGTEETPLLIGAPLALALALAISSTAITTLARRNDINQLGRIGMMRTSTLAAVARQALAVTVPPALVALALSGIIVTAATTPFTSALGTHPPSLGPISAYLLVSVLFVIVVLITATTTTRRFRPT